MSFFKMKRSFFILFILFVGIAVACSETTIDVNEIHYIGNVQTSLTQLIDSRSQVYDVGISKNSIIVTLKDSTIRIDTESFPFLSVNTNECWTINNKELTNVRVYIEDGQISFPDLLIHDGNLYVNGIITNFSWKPKTSDAIAASDEWIFAAAKANDYICFYRSNGVKVILPIIDNANFVVPDYFFDSLVTKERLSEEIAKGLPSEQQHRYIFFTDAHWGRNQKHSPALIKHIVDYSGINQVLFGGDANTSFTDTPQGTLDIGFQFHQAFSFLGPKLFCVFGNHDDNSTGQATSFERHLTEDQVYAFLQSQMTNVHYWDYYNFYYDDLNSKTRFLCMDTGRFYEASLRGKLTKTAKFAIESLMEVPNGWHIVAASHIWCNLRNYDTGETAESVYIRPIIEVLENYNLRKKGFFTYNGETLEYDFSNVGAVVEYCIGGHTHGDAVVPSRKGLPLIIVTCDAQQEVAGGAPYDTGTVNEQCVTIVLNDYQNKEVNILHVGRGEDLKTKMWESATII